MTADLRTQLESSLGSHSLVLDSPCHARHEDVMVHAVEELLEVQVHHPPWPFHTVSAMRGTRRYSRRTCPAASSAHAVM